MRGGRGERQETKVFPETQEEHSGGSNNEEATVLHLEYKVKKVCFGRKVLGRFDPQTPE